MSKSKVILDLYEDGWHVAIDGHPPITDKELEACAMVADESLKQARDPRHIAEIQALAAALRAKKTN